MSRNNWKTIIVIVVFIILAIPALIYAGGESSSDNGYTFTLEISNPGSDRITFNGSVLGDNMKLSSTVGGIQTVNLITGGKFFVLTPAIKTATELDLPDAPSPDGETWQEWLSEPAHINPLNFARIAGAARDADGEVTFGADGCITALFTDGRLASLWFPANGSREEVMYNYSNFEEDSELSRADFQVPDDYLVTE